jgi:hypothetical protein
MILVVATILFLGLLDPEDGGLVLLRSIGNYLPLTRHNSSENMNLM